MPNEVGFLGSEASQPLRAAFATSKTSRHVVLAEPRREPLSLFPASYAAPILIHNACGASRKVRADISQRPFRPLGTTKHLLKKNFKRYKSLKVLSYG
ncbi:MAG: hypothetical protein IKK20_04230 [Clostridia bacterium]|nr:hypothetical protein [Clostridia bacterium]